MRNRIALSMILLVVAGVNPLSFQTDDARAAKSAAPVEFGTLVNLEKDFSEDGSDMAYLFRILSKANVKWVRSPVPLKGDEADYDLDSPDVQMRMQEIDRFINLAGSNGLKVILTIKPSQKLSKRERKRRNHGAPQVINRLDDWARFMKQLSARYRGKVDVWQLGNEMNHVQNWTGSPSDYVKLLKATYRAVKSSDPTAKVMLGGLAGGDIVSGGGKNPDAVEYFQSLADAGALKYCDLVDAHIYREPASYCKVYSGYTAIMKRLGILRPIWVTESGYGVQLDDLDDANLSYEVVKRLSLPASYGYQVVLWSRSIERRENRKGSQSPKGLLDEAWDPKPAYYAFQTTARLLSGTVPAGRVKSADGEKLLVFKAKDRTVLVAWTTGNPRTIRLSIPGGGVLYYPTGDKKPLSGSASLSVSISSRPILIKSIPTWTPAEN